LFIDTAERLHHSSIFSLTPGKNRVVFLEEVSVEQYTMQDIQQLKQVVYDIMDAGLRRYRKYPSAA
jgi:1-acyl-sn-glycerol-3-phosphate acyltransferase